MGQIHYWGREDILYEYLGFSSIVEEKKHVITGINMRREKLTDFRVQKMHKNTAYVLEWMIFHFRLVGARENESWLC